MPISPKAARYRGAVSGLKRAINNGECAADDPRLVEAQRGLAAAKIESYVEKVLADAPELTDEQRAQLAELLKPARV